MCGCFSLHLSSTITGMFGCAMRSATRSSRKGRHVSSFVVRAHNRGPQVLVTRVELEGREGSPEHLTWLTMPTSLEKGDAQLWYMKARAELPVDVCARITLADGKRI